MRLGHARADFGAALVVIGGVEQKAHFFVIPPPQGSVTSVKLVEFPV